MLAGTMALQLALAYRCCRLVGLAPGRAKAAMVRPLLGYGVAQIAAVAPAALNAQLDQLVLSQTVPSADLGRYAVAVSLTLLPTPIVSAIGYVAFPHLAAQREITAATRRLQRIAVLSSASLAVGMLLPLAAASYWIVPLVFGEAYRGAVPLVWVRYAAGIRLSRNGTGRRRHFAGTRTPRRSGMVPGARCGVYGRMAVCIYFLL